MNELDKKRVLQDCNLLDLDILVSFIVSKKITIDELIDAGLDIEKIKKLKKTIDVKIDIEGKEGKKQEILQNILLNKISAEVIKDNVEANIISIIDIENLVINKRNKKALLNYIESNNKIESYSIDKLDPMVEGRTDIYCIGLAGTGKTTMLSGLLKLGTQQGKIIQDTFAGSQGIRFSNTIIQNLNRGFIPPRTLEDSFIYVPISLKDDKGILHPLNIVDVPGEIFKDISESGEVKSFLKYINNKNKKIFFIVVDPYLHYNPTKDSKDQSLEYPNILQILKSEGIAEHIDAIYLVTNKFDFLKDNYYPFDDREEGDIALEFINTNFRALITSCLNVKEHSRYDFKLKSLPFSIGNLKWGAVLEEFDAKFSETLLEILINDSFVVRGGAGKTWR